VDIAGRLGGEIVRLWVASVDFRNDVVGSEQLMQRVGENYRKLRNTFKYILGNLHGFDPAKDAVPFASLEPLDQYMVRQVAALTGEVLTWYEEFAFHKVYQRITQYCVVDLSAVYFDVLKDRLYTAAPNSRARRSAQTVLWKIGEALSRLLAPILSFTCEEVWQYLPRVPGRPESPHLALFPEPGDILEGASAEDKVQQDNWSTLLQTRNDVLKALEDARNSKLIGGSLEAKVQVLAADPVYSVLARYRDQLRYLFIVSAVSLEQAATNGNAPVAVQVSKADGAKCERCWNYSVQVGKDANYPTVCERCSAVLKEIEGR
jgi:isoleucyl-tRNA synthetase